MAVRKSQPKRGAQTRGQFAREYAKRAQKGGGEGGGKGPTKKRAAKKTAPRKKKPPRDADPAADQAKAQAKAQPETETLSEDPSAAEIRHEEFAQLMASGRYSQTQAYLEVYDTDPAKKLGVAAAMVSASRLIRNPKVAARIQALRIGAEDEAAIILAEIKLEARDLFHLAKTAGELAAANAALKNLAIIHGHWVEKRNVDGQVEWLISDQPLEEEEGANGHDPDEAWAGKFKDAAPS